MRTSKTLCILTSAIILTSFTACGKDNAGDNSTSSTTESRKQSVRFTGYVNVPEGKGHLMLHAEPNVFSKEVAPVLLNERADVLEEKDDWFYVDCSGFKGYIQKEYISLVEITETEAPTTESKTSASKTTTSTETTETETSTTAETTEDNDKDESSEKDDDNDRDDDSDHSSGSPSDNDTHQSNNPNNDAPVVKYPSVSVSLAIDPYKNDPEKYEFYMNVTGQFTYYKYEAYRILPEGVEKKLASGESSDSRLTLAIYDTLLESGALDRVKITPYLDSVEGDSLDLELYEPVKTW